MSSRSKRRTVPDWHAVQCGENAGKNLSALWRDHAASAAQPYGYAAFRKEFRKWQAAAPSAPSAEYAASDIFWHGRAAIRPDILVLDNGATVRVHGGICKLFRKASRARLTLGRTIVSPKRSFSRVGAVLSPFKPPAFVLITRLP
jgi:hypothetical protein